MDITRCVELLLEAGADITAIHGKFALVDAAKNGHENCFEALIKGGFRVDSKDGLGRTPLMMAASNGHHMSVRSLLKAGADVNRVTNDMETTLQPEEVTSIVWN